jgi:hypothetical protein
MKILLIDADSTIPNLALMKLSTYYKEKGNTIILRQLNIPYYPNRKKKIHIINTNKFDKIFCSIIFPGNNKYIKGNNIIFGGTGTDLSIKLPEEIENKKPDYSIYPKNNISYGFISRGCIRKCSFCFVPEKEGYIRQVNIIENIVRHKIVKFMDNNFLALPNCKELLQELIDKNIKCQFNQGLDIRIINQEISILLSKLNYYKEYIFAFDNIKYRNLIGDKLELLYWRRDWQFKFFVYVHPNMKIEDTLERIRYLGSKKCLPYIMRDITCWNSEYKDFYTDIASWCNQPSLFKKMTFKTFLEKRYLGKNRDKRINSSLNLYNLS